MKVLTQRPLPSRVMLISTGNGILAGSPIVATSLACHSPLASCFTSQIFEVSAAAAPAQLSPGFKDQRISSGPPGTLTIFSGFWVFSAFCHGLSLVFAPGDAWWWPSFFPVLRGEAVAVSVPAVVDRHRVARDEVAFVVV